jgi:hypothetical protein
MSEKKASKAEEAQLFRLVELQPQNVIIDSVLATKIEHSVSQPDHMTWSIGSLFLCVVWGKNYFHY